MALCAKTRFSYYAAFISSSTNNIFCNVQFHNLRRVLINIQKKVLAALFYSTLDAELNPVCHLLALLGGEHILHVFRIRVKLRLFRKSQKI